MRASPHAALCLQLQAGHRLPRQQPLRACRGHRSIQQTMHYSAPTPRRFKGVWQGLEATDCRD